MTYRVKNWDTNFESYETKKLTHLKWVPVPNKHDGLTYRRVAAQKNSCELYTAWTLILQVASKSKKGERGSLIRDQKALNADDLAIMTGFPVKIFQSALEFFSSPEIGWLEVDSQEDTVLTAGPAVFPADAAVLAVEKQPEGKGMERKGIEGKGTLGKAIESPQRQIDEMSDEQYLSHLETQGAYVGINIRAEFQKMLNWCSLHRKQATRRRFLNWLNRVDRPISGTASPQLQLQAPKPTVFGLTKQIEFIDGEIKKCTEEQIEIGDHVRRVPKQGMEQRVREMRAKVKTLKDQLTKL
jgi:hypothetical protein